MPKYRYEGIAPCFVGSAEVKPGAIVESSFSPGKRFSLVEKHVLTGPRSVAQPLDEPSIEAPGKSHRKGGN